jgi:hypothetical protein
VYFHEGDLLGKGHCNNGWSSSKITCS